MVSIGIRPNSLKLAVHDGISDGIKTDRGGTMLTDLAVRKATPRDKAYKLSDGGGLYLLVTKAGQRYWRMDYRFGERRATAALGVYPTITLAEARTKRLEIKKQIAEGDQPSGQAQDRQDHRAACQCEQLQGRCRRVAR